MVELYGHLWGMNEIVEKFKETFCLLDAKHLHLLPELYAREVIFEDPFHRIEGLSQLTEYFASLYLNIEKCDFQFAEQCVEQNQAFYRWVCEFSHPKIRRGELIHFSGASFIRFNTKVTYHRDYFDGADMLYGHIPVLRQLINFVKKRV